MPGSEVAQIKERIAAEYMAAKWGLYGLSCGTSTHQFITNHMERMQESNKELAGIVGDQQAMIIVAEMLERLPEQPERAYVLSVIRHLRGNTEQIRGLLEGIENMWATMDLLIQEFGKQDAWKVINALPDHSPEAPKS